MDLWGFFSFPLSWLWWERYWAVSRGVKDIQGVHGPPLFRSLVLSSDFSLQRVDLCFEGDWETRLDDKKSVLPLLDTLQSVEVMRFIYRWIEAVPTICSAGGSAVFLLSNGTTIPDPGRGEAASASKWASSRSMPQSGPHLPGQSSHNHTFDNRFTYRGSVSSSHLQTR